MTDFSYLDTLEVQKDAVIDFTLDDLEGAPMLCIKQAGEGNPAYMNELLRVSGTGARARKSRQKVSAKFIDEARDQDRSLYPSLVITGWKEIKDSKGKNVKFTDEACRSFIALLPAWIFDKVRLAASSPESFLPVIDSEEKSGN